MLLTTTHTFTQVILFTQDLFVLEAGKLLLIKKCKKKWCKIKAGEIKGWIKKETLWGLFINYFLYFAVQILSKTKYQTALANGSTIASVRAIIKELPQLTLKLLLQ